MYWPLIQCHRRSAKPCKGKIWELEKIKHIGGVRSPSTSPLFWRRIQVYLCMCRLTAFLSLNGYIDKWRRCKISESKWIKVLLFEYKFFRSSCWIQIYALCICLATYRFSILRLSPDFCLTSTMTTPNEGEARLEFVRRYMSSEFGATVRMPIAPKVCRLTRSLGTLYQARWKRPQ